MVMFIISGKEASKISIFAPVLHVRCPMQKEIKNTAFSQENELFE